jgi:hypothetical protein
MFARAGTPTPRALPPPTGSSPMARKKTYTFPEA